MDVLFLDEKSWQANASSMVAQEGHPEQHPCKSNGQKRPTDLACQMAFLRAEHCYVNP